MKIVVIGGTGLIGSRVVTGLREQGHDVVAASPRTGVNSVTGEGLTDALAGAVVVVDVANSPSFADDAVMAFFRASTGNLVQAAASAGVRHYVALSIVGVDAIPDSGYMRAKTEQERLIRASGLPYSIVRATQFFEFLDGIADMATEGSTVRLAPFLLQPVAAADVAAAVVRVALSEPIDGTVDIAGPERFSQVDAIRRLLVARHDPREIVVDPQARYNGARLSEAALVPAGEASLGRVTLEDWLGETALRVAP